MKLTVHISLTCRLILLSAMGLSTLGCFSNCGDSDDFRVKYVTHDVLWKFPELDTAAVYDTRTREVTYLQYDLAHVMRQTSLSTGAYTPPDFTFYGISTDYRDCWPARDLLWGYDPEKIWVVSGVECGHHERRLAALGYYVSILDGYGLPAVAPKPSPMYVGLMNILCSYDMASESFTLVDSASASEANFGGKYGRSFCFDRKGDYLYYRKGKHALRYDVETQSKDTLPAGQDPVIPFNTDDILVYDADEKRLYQLDSRLEVTRSIDADLGTTLTAYALNGNTFVLGTSMPANLSHWSGYMAVVVVDLSRGCVRHLFDTDRGELLQVWRY